MMNDIDTVTCFETTAYDVTLATVVELRSPDTGHQRPQGFVRHEYSPLLTSAHIDVTHRPIRYAKPKPFAFPNRRQMRSITADRWMRQRFNAAKVVAHNELSSAGFSIDNMDALAPTFPLGRAALGSIQLALISVSRCLRFHKKIVH